MPRDLRTVRLSDGHSCGLHSSLPAGPAAKGNGQGASRACFEDGRETGTRGTAGSWVRAALQTGGTAPLCCPNQICSPGGEARSWSHPRRNSVGKKSQDGSKNLCGRKVFLCLVPVELLLLVTNTKVSLSSAGSVALPALSPALCRWGLSLGRCAGFWSVSCAAFCPNRAPWPGQRVLWLFNLLLILFLFCPHRNLSASPLTMRSGKRGR